LLADRSLITLDFNDGTFNGTADTATLFKLLADDL